MRRIKLSNLLICLVPVCYLIIAVAVVCLISWNGAYPEGTDTMYHVYRGEMVYQSIQEGVWWPQLNPMWYNGVQLMRFWAPLCAYFMAFCQFLAGGNSLNGYLLFVGLICFLGALPWLYIGFREKRPCMGAILGALWFFMPNNLYAVFVEGNLARCLSMIFLPIFLYGVFSYLEAPRRTALALVICSFILIILCHLGYAGMLALAVLLYLLVDKLICKRKRGARTVIAAMLFSFLALGVWLVPSLMGGTAVTDVSEIMEGFFQSAFISLNPFDRYTQKYSNFYFGAAAMLLAVLGSIFSYKREMPGFWTGILIFACTTSSMYYVLRLLPGSQFLWMLRFISIALCMILLSFLYWKTLRRPLALLILLLLFVDMIPSLRLIYGCQSGQLVEERLNSQGERTFIRPGQDLTEQRLALIDLNRTESTGAWMVSSWGEKPVCAVYGAGWTAANTAVNMFRLDQAMMEGNFLYLFDRCKELGSDTVILFPGEFENKNGKTKEQVDGEAAAAGFSFVDGNETAWLYHLNMDISGAWGTVSKYRGIALGAEIGLDVSRLGICRNFPVLREAETDNLNDYTFEELSQYDMIYLVGFSYDDRAEAEDLILRLSEAGVRVVISADGIPEDRKTYSRSFLGVTCNQISFSNGYPEMDTIDGLLNTDLFPPDYTEWNTVYLEGLDDVWGTVYDDGLLLDFYGTVKNENIVFVGLNLTYFLSLTQDPAVERLLSHAMDLSPAELPERELVPLEIRYGKNSITIVSPRDHVNTSLAYHDIFESDRPISSQNHLMVVDGGVTNITLRYPSLTEGTAVSVAGIVLLLFLLLFHKKGDDEWKLQEEHPQGGQIGQPTTQGQEAGSPPSRSGSPSGN
ncbi:6-pyruvoyl-tetrahydropterin synthase-related protein [uncultured Oscillibacter sp.]|uniref:6-pyruvoyl-tetrahydropterin synthase-related protein n=1 Tax=uncultured Oscillibacter sp. TaxID=876091 RepID=UPI00260635F4|nr:6-pyruvoyl-tetrahydropterin synthase-related protein [uncultured Oscillibacter sp.]